MSAANEDVGVQTLLERLAAVEADVAGVREQLAEAEQGRRAAEGRERQVSEALDRNQAVLDGLQRHLDTAAELARAAKEVGVWRGKLAAARARARQVGRAR